MKWFICTEVLALVGGSLSSVLEDYDADQVLCFYSDHTHHNLPRAGSEAVSCVMRVCVWAGGT